MKNEEIGSKNEGGMGEWGTPGVCVRDGRIGVDEGRGQENEEEGEVLSF